MVRCPKLSAADQAARRRTMKALWTKTNRASNLQKTRDYTRVQVAKYREDHPEYVIQERNRKIDAPSACQARYDFDQLAFERDQHIQNEKAARMCFCIPQAFKLKYLDRSLYFPISGDAAPLVPAPEEEAVTEAPPRRLIRTRPAALEEDSDNDLDFTLQENHLAVILNQRHSF
jgi:hypothetical protein